MPSTRRQLRVIRSLSSIRLRQPPLRAFALTLSAIAKRHEDVPGTVNAAHAPVKHTRRQPAGLSTEPTMHLPDPLPLLPAELLRRHNCTEPTDTRFRAVARLRQSLWREHQASRNDRIG